MSGMLLPLLLLLLLPLLLPQPLLPLPWLSLSPPPLPLLPPLQLLLLPLLSLSPLPSLSVLPPPLPGHVHGSFPPPRHQPHEFQSSCTLRQQNQMGAAQDIRRSNPRRK